MNLDKLMGRNGIKTERQSSKMGKKTKEIGILAGIIVLFFAALFLVFFAGGDDSNVELTNEQQAKIAGIANDTSKPNTPQANVSQIEPQSQIDIAAIERDMVKQDTKEVSDLNQVLQGLKEKDDFTMPTIAEAEGDGFGLSAKAQLDVKKQEQNVEYIKDMKKYLNTIKRDISLSGTSFIFQGKQFFVGERFMNLNILEINKQYIRFSGENWEYALRFF